MRSREKGTLSKGSFREAVLKAVAAIPAGQTKTYKQIACQAGRPGAFRAVGNILHTNFDPQIPCHRVVRSDGQIGGYNRGVKQKIRLLRKEGVK